MSSAGNPILEGQTGVQSPPTEASPVLPKIPTADLSLDFSSIIGTPSPDEDKMQKRASKVMKLTQEYEKLKAELKAMTDQLEAAELRQERLAMLATKEQKIMEEPSS